MIQESKRKKLKKQVGATIYSRGFSYYRKKVVGRITVTPHTAGWVRVEARVSGSDIYETEVLFNMKTGGLSHFVCSCPYDWGTCKHATALGLTLFDRYEEFCESGVDASGVAEYKEVFSEWMERSPLNFAKRWEESSARISSQKKAVTRDTDMILGKTTAVSVMDPLGDLKRRLRSIGIDVESVPETVISRSFSWKRKCR